jgi:hypothetical protein
MCFLTDGIETYLPVLFWYLQGLLTLVIAFLAFHIARQQWKTNQQKLKLDLYDRRLKVFQAVRDVLGLMYTQVSDDQKLYTLLNETRGAGFLFGDEIQNYIESIWRHATNLSDTHKNLNAILDTAQPNVRKPLADTESQEVKWAFAETRVIEQKFKQFLDLSNL